MASLPSEKTKTFIVVLLDESGSMDAMKGFVIAGYNGFLSEQKQVATDDARLSLVKFNTETIVGHLPLDLKSAPSLSPKNYNPDGGTALFDAIAEGVRIADKSKKADERVLCLIITDGAENASKETTLKQVQDIISAKEACGDWTFAYIGEEPKGWAGSAGMTAANTTQDHQDPGYNFVVASKATSTYRTKGLKKSLNFFSRK